MGLHLKLRGSIQGIGFRPWIRRAALALDVRGSVANTPDGVCIDALGGDAALDAFQALIAAPPLPGANVESVTATDWNPRSEPARFEIVESRTRSNGPAEVSLTPDLPTCPACLDELFTTSSRRFRHPFIACTACGPRYTIARDLPWDRERTAMADFPLCPDCATEYEDPDDRRSHAESTSCPVCGPSLYTLAHPDGTPARQEAALATALEALGRGQIVAVQGIGGFHLACDASSEPAVRRLRERKRRPRRPLAIMLRTLAEAEKHVVIDDAERRLLESDARPIVLLRRRPDSNLAASLAPESPMLGVVLAYTPLHTLLLAGFGRPLVMTSANRSGDPIVYRPADAVTSLADIADMVLANDREIVAPCDDSVARSSAGGTIWMRRSRGHAPRPIRLARPVERSTLAFGGQWSNTICLARGELAWPSAHVGDIESPDSLARLEETARHWLRWLDIEPELVAHDLHPGYESTRLALAWPGAKAIGVQHHHAHMAAVLGEHGSEGPALALTWDGTGAGHDGAAWGGELLFGDIREVQRLATFRPIALAGGERAIREPWRLALALLQDAFEGDAPIDRLDLFRSVRPDRRDAVLALLAEPGLCVGAHGVGRYFDAVAALLLQRPEATYSGELAQSLNFLASGRAAALYPFALNTSTMPWQIDLRPAIREMVDDILTRRPSSEIADRFHATLAAAGEAAVREALRALPEARTEAPGGRARVVLAGGCFQNPILLDALESRLAADTDVLRPMQLPPGDGGLSFGQALVADAVASRPSPPSRRTDGEES